MFTDRAGVERLSVEVHSETLSFLTPASPRYSDALENRTGSHGEESAEADTDTAIAV